MTGNYPSSSVPIVPLPRNVEQSEAVLKSIYRLYNDGKQIGGTTAFKNLINEMVNNIYEHSAFTNAYLMAQKYPTKGFVDICFCDDGIGIHGSMKKFGMIFDDDFMAIRKAISGTSSKMTEGRGYGLSTNIRMCTEGFGGQFLVVSGSGAISLSNNESQRQGYKLSEQSSYSGTIISIRVPFPAPEVNIYEFQN